MVDLRGGVVEIKALGQHLLKLTRPLVAVRGPADQDVRGQGQKSAGDEPDVHVVDGGDARLAGDGGHDVGGRVAFWRCFEQDPAGLAQQTHAACSMSPTTIRDAIESARSNPVIRMIMPATRVPMKPYRSVMMCANAPLTLTESRLAFDGTAGRRTRQRLLDGFGSGAGPMSLLCQSTLEMPGARVSA